MQLFHGAPGGIADAPAVRFGRDKQKIEIAPRTVHPDNDVADRLPVLHDPIGFAAVNGLFDGLAGDDFALLLEVVMGAWSVWTGKLETGRKWIACGVRIRDTSSYMSFGMDFRSI